MNIPLTKRLLGVLSIATMLLITACDSGVNRSFLSNKDTNEGATGSTLGPGGNPVNLYSTLSFSSSFRRLELSWTANDASTYSIYAQNIALDPFALQATTTTNNWAQTINTHQDDILSKYYIWSCQSENCLDSNAIEPFSGNVQRNMIGYIKEPTSKVNSNYGFDAVISKNDRVMVVSSRSESTDIDNIYIYERGATFNSWTYSTSFDISASPFGPLSLAISNDGSLIAVGSSRQGSGGSVSLIKKIKCNLDTITNHHSCCPCSQCRLRV